MIKEKQSLPDLFQKSFRDKFGLPKLVVFDIDNTVADNEHREHLFEQDRYEEAERLAHLDPAIHASVFVCRQFLNYREYEVLFLSGRDDVMLEVTHKWLVKHVSPSISVNNIKLRPPELAHLSNAEFKGVMLDELLRTREVFCMFEDKPAVIEIAQAKGIMCFQVHR